MEKRYDFSAAAEQVLYDDWESSGAFRCGGAGGSEGASERKTYTIMMPPPNVTGRLHIGHALDNTLQDILVRYHRMRGFDCLWLPGTDHAGIATQLLVSKQLTASGVDVEQLTREEFLEHIWRWKDEYGNIILQQLRRLGASCDWSRARFTMDEGFSRSVRKAFVRMYEDGLIYRAERLVNWDPRLETAISDLEVNQVTQRGELCLIDYPLVALPAADDATQPSSLPSSPPSSLPSSPPSSPPCSSAVITIATMRPETLFGDSAVAVHPDDERYAALIGGRCSVPLTGREVPIIADTRVEREQGTGALKITPAHDFLDFAIGDTHSLESIVIFDKRARLNDNVPPAYRGLSREQARKAVVANLREQGLLRETREQEHSVPHGERSGVALEPRLTKQWFVDMENLAKRALKAVEDKETLLLPDIWHSTWRNWLANIQPWCISRQLLWGHRIPIWYTDSGEEIAAADEESAFARAREKFGKEFDKDVSLRQDEDVLDTWFSSALWPFATLGWSDEKFTESALLERHFPTNILITGFDILFFWVARMMMMSFYFMERAPFKVVYLHALIRDARGRKMSKSLGNVVNPLDLMTTYGSDALRFTLALQAIPGRDLRLEEKRIEGNRNFITKLWNAARFLELQECRYNKDFDISVVEGSLHRWMLVRLRETADKVERALDEKNCRFDEASAVLYHFLWDVFCDQYLEMVKQVLLTGNVAAKEEARLASAWIFYGLLRLLHPFVPFVTEKIFCSADIFASRSKDERLITAQWLDAEKLAFTDNWKKNEVEELEWLLGLVKEVRSLRACLGLAPREVATLRCKELTSQAENDLDAWAAVLRGMAGVEWLGRERGGGDGKKEEKRVGFVYRELISAGLALPLDFDIAAAKNRAWKQYEHWHGKFIVLNEKLHPDSKFFRNAPAAIKQAEMPKRDEAQRNYELWLGIYRDMCKAKAES